MTDITREAAPATDVTARLAASGDEAAFTRLVDRHHASMARVAYAITGDVEAARDATQTAWATAWRRLPSLRDKPGSRLAAPVADQRDSGAAAMAS